MDQWLQGRHRLTGEEHAGRHRDPDEDRLRGAYQGRHRAVGVQRAAISPLLVASGSLAAAALAAIVLSGSPGPSGELLADREQEPRPAASWPTARGGEPTAADLDRMVKGYLPGYLMGSSWGLSVWDVLFQQDAGAPSSVLGAMCDGMSGGTAVPAGGSGSSSTAVVQAGTPPTPPTPTTTWTATTTPTTSTSTTSPAASTSTTSPSSGTAPPADSGFSTATVEGPPVRMVGPSPVPDTVAPTPDGDGGEGAPVLGPVPEPVAPVVEPVAPVVEPVVEPVAPLVEQAAPEVDPVAEVVEAAPEAVEPVAEVVEAAPEAVEAAPEEIESVTEELPGPADIPSAEDTQSVSVDLVG